MSSEELCQLCNTGRSKYNCPRCNLAYCSVACYKSPNHLKCSEEFYKECVVQEMTAQQKPTNVPGSSDDVKQMYEILKRIENNGLNDSDSGSELSDDENDELDSDDEMDIPDDNDLSKRLEGIDLNDADAIWSHLTEAERQEFNIIEHPDIISPIVDFRRISTKEPAPCVLNNLINVLASYVSMVRFFYGEHETSKQEAVNYVVAICANLRTNANFDDSDLAIESVRQDGLNEGYSIDESDIRQIKKDVDRLMGGPISNKQTNTYALAALSDLHRLFAEVKSELKSTRTKPMDSTDQVQKGPTDSETPTTSDEPSKPTINGSETFSKRFNEHKVEQRLEKGKITTIMKKIEYYLAYVNKYH